MRKNDINVLGFNCSRESIEEVVEKLNHFKKGYAAYCFMSGEMVYRGRRPSTISRDIALNLLVVDNELPEGKSEWTFKDIVCKFADSLWITVYHTSYTNIYYTRKYEMFTHFEDALVVGFDFCFEFEFADVDKRLKIIKYRHAKVCTREGKLSVSDPFMNDTISEYPYTWLWLRTALYYMVNVMENLSMEPYTSGIRIVNREKFDAVKAKMWALTDLLAVNNLGLIPIIMKDGV